MSKTGPHLKDRIKYAASPVRWWHAGVGILVGVAFALIANVTGDGNALALWWTNWLDPIITVATLVVAALLFVGSAMTAWEERLEKRLDVHCRYKGRYVGSCWEATLAHEGDIRQWGQQVGRQMLDVRELLKFTVTPAFDPPEIRYDDMGARRVYSITIDLTEDPTPDDRYVVWDHRNGRRLYRAERPEHPLPLSSQELASDPIP